MLLTIDISLRCFIEFATIAIEVTGKFNSKGETIHELKAAKLVF